MSQPQHMVAPTNPLRDGAYLLTPIHTDDSPFAKTKSSWARKSRLERMKKRHTSLSPPPANRQRQKQQQKKQYSRQACRWQSLPEASKEKVRSRPVPPRRQRSLDDTSDLVDPLKRQDAFNKAASSGRDPHSVRRTRKKGPAYSRDIANNSSFMQKQRTS